MKKLKRFPEIILGFAMSVIVLVACQAEKTDADIKASVDKELMEHNDFAGLTATVNNAVVTLSGQVADQKIKDDAEDEVEDVSGVKSVVNEITVTAPEASITVAPDATLQASVETTVKDYPFVKASVDDGVVTLTGEIKKDELQELMMELSQLKPKKIENKLVIKV